MAKRRTIGRDPLSEATSGATYSAEIVPISIQSAAAKDRISPTVEPPEAIRPEPLIVVVGKARRSVGGRLEILGGDLGSGIRVIWPLDSNRRVGFVAPNGRTIDLAQELDVVQASPDRTEHRYLSAIGWAWVLASVGGFIGLAAAGGLRLLEPRRMIVKMELSDGSKLVVRTDSVTVVGLRAFAESRSAAKA